MWPQVSWFLALKCGFLPGNSPPPVPLPDTPVAVPHPGFSTSLLGQAAALPAEVPGPQGVPSAQGRLAFPVAKGVGPSMRHQSCAQVFWSGGVGAGGSQPKDLLALLVQVAEGLMPEACGQGHGPEGASRRQSLKNERSRETGIRARGLSSHDTQGSL